MIVKARFKFNRAGGLKFIRRDSLNLARRKYPRSLSHASSKSKFKRTLRSSKDKILRVCIANIKFRAYRHRVLRDTTLAIPRSRLMRYLRLSSNFAIRFCPQSARLLVQKRRLRSLADAATHSQNFTGVKPRRAEPLLNFKEFIQQMDGGPRCSLMNFTRARRAN